MNMLHQAGILWGDINQGNIIIEEATNKAWIVNIGGGDNRVMLREERFKGFTGDLEALTRFCKS
jgi:tRNA A-37 threonylcarbamoyl transferase component Bud32